MNPESRAEKEAEEVKVNAERKIPMLPPILHPVRPVYSKASLKPSWWG